MPEIDDIIERKAASSDATGTIVAAIRLLNKGVTRWALRALMKEVEMRGERKPLMEWALAKYAG
ncbi:MAG: radical SAM/SPASM domain-containing protein, partial [Thermocladium sp.]